MKLSVAVIAALGGVVFLGEPITACLGLASIAILDGIVLVILKSAAHPERELKSRSD